MGMSAALRRVASTMLSISSRGRRFKCLQARLPFLRKAMVKGFRKFAVCQAHIEFVEKRLNFGACLRNGEDTHTGADIQRVGKGVADSAAHHCAKHQPRAEID